MVLICVNVTLNCYDSRSGNFIKQNDLPETFGKKSLMDNSNLKTKQFCQYPILHVGEVYLGRIPKIPSSPKFLIILYFDL